MRLSAISYERHALLVRPYPKTVLLLHISMCRPLRKKGHIPTNLAIDDHLLEEAQKIGRRRTKRETVSAALEEYIAHRKQQEILPLFSKIDYDRRFDYKRERKSKRL